MIYKEEIQIKNAEKLKAKLEEENIPRFIQNFFLNKESKLGAINYWIAIKDLLMYLLEEGIIDKDSLSSITPDDFIEVEAADINTYLERKEQRRILSPTTLKTRKNIFQSFWEHLIYTTKCPVTINIVKNVAYKGVSSTNDKTRENKLPTEKQLSLMEERIMKKKDDFVRVRNLTILKVLKGSGIREGELAGLDISDLFLSGDLSLTKGIPYIEVVGKGKYRKRESRVVRLTRNAAEALLAWLKIRETILPNNTDAVFLNKNGRGLNEDNI